MNPLLSYFLNNKGLMMNKWPHYFEHYHSHLAKYVGQSVTLVEVSVAHGGSLQMWRSYLGKSATIVGVDINPKVKALEKLGFRIEIGDQSSFQFWQNFTKKYKEIDVLIDDGGHSSFMQVATFSFVFPFMTNNATYICEDIGFGMHLTTAGLPGGLKPQDTFVNLLKNLIDSVEANSQVITMNISALAKNNYYDEVMTVDVLAGYFEGVAVNEPNLNFDKEKLLLTFEGGVPKSQVNYYTKAVKGIHVYDQIAVIEKQEKNTEEPDGLKESGTVDAYTDTAYSMTTGNVTLLDFIAGAKLEGVDGDL